MAPRETVAKYASAVGVAAALALGVLPAHAQRPGTPTPASHASRALLAEPVFTTPAMVVGSWPTTSLVERNALTGEPRRYEVVVTDTDVTVTSQEDAFGPRSFGIVRARAVDAWVEYELRGQGGTYLMTAQLGTRTDGGREALFVLSHPGASAKIERFAAIRAGTDVARSTPSSNQPSVEMRPRRISQPTADASTPLRVTPADFIARAERKVTPTYPAAARASSAQGVVAVEVAVDERGRVTSAKALSGPAVFHPEAVRAALQWRFKPFERDGAPARATGILTFKFAR